MTTFPSQHEVERWVSRYACDHEDLLERDPGFREWLATEYVPLAGGWLY